MEDESKTVAKHFIWTVVIIGIFVIIVLFNIFSGSKTSTTGQAVKDEEIQVVKDTGKEESTQNLQKEPVKQPNTQTEEVIKYICPDEKTTVEDINDCPESTIKPLQDTDSDDSDSTTNTEEDLEPSYVKEAYKRCYNENLYWHDSNNNRMYVAEVCVKACDTENDICCQENAYTKCDNVFGNRNLYWYNSCDIKGNIAENCKNSCKDGACIICNGNLDVGYNICYGHDLYWYMPCTGNSNRIEICQDTCLNGECIICPEPSYGECKPNPMDRWGRYSFLWHNPCSGVNTATLCEHDCDVNRGCI